MGAPRDAGTLKMEAYDRMATAPDLAGGVLKPQMFGARV